MSRILKGALRYRGHPDLLQSLNGAIGDAGSRTSALRGHPCYFELPSIALPTSLDQGAINVLRELPTTPQLLQERSGILSNHLWNRSLPLIREKRREVQAELMRSQASGEEEYGGGDLVTEVVQTIEKKELQKMVKQKVAEWKPLRYTGHICHVYMVTRLAPNFATTCRVLYEIRKRCPSFQPSSVFDFGSGLGTVSWAAQSIWPDISEHLQVDASSDMLQLSSLLLRGGHQHRDPLLPGLHQRQFLAASASRKYDLVVLAHSLLDLDGMQASRDRVLANLWAKTGQFLVLVEQGTKAGFAALLEARDTLLKQAENVQSAAKKPQIFAPCPHHLTCGKAESICNFFVKYKKMNITMPENAHQKEVFCYLIMSKGPWPDQEAVVQGLPRVVSYKLKYPKSTVMHDLCTSTGEVERNIFAKATTEKTLYRFLKYSGPGDIAPLERIDAEEPEESKQLLESEQKDICTN